RALLAIANGCLFVSESSSSTTPLVEGEHFVMGGLDDLPSLCRYYLEQQGKAASLTARAYAFVRDHHSAGQVCAGLLKVLDAAPPPPPPGPAAAGPRRAAEAGRVAGGRVAVLRRGAPPGPGRGAGRRVGQPGPNRRYEGGPNPSVSVIVTLYNYARYVDE